MVLLSPQYLKNHSMFCMLYVDLGDERFETVADHRDMCMEYP